MEGTGASGHAQTWLSQAGVGRKWVLHLEAVCVKLMRGVLGALVGSGAGLGWAADYVPVTA